MVLGYARGLALTVIDPDNSVNPSESIENPVEAQADQASSPLSNVAETAETAAENARRRVLIGSQRDPAAYRARPKRDWAPIADKQEKKNKVSQGGPQKVEDQGRKDSSQNQEGRAKAPEAKVREATPEMAADESAKPADFVSSAFVSQSGHGG